MSFIINPSLKHMCLAKIATQLWNEDFVVDKCTYNGPISINALAKMRKKVKNLPIPTTLKKQLTSFILPISNQIYDWYRFLHYDYNVKSINLKNLRYTSYGTIDKVKSVQVLLQRDQNLDLKQRYRLACTFCLVEQVLELLRKEMPEEEKLPVLAYSSLVQANEQDLVVDFIQCAKDSLINFEEDAPQYLSPYNEACHVAILCRNPVATKFFFQKLSSEEKSKLFSLLQVQFVDNISQIGCVFNPEEFLAELICFLLSQMDEKQREEFFKAYPGWVVRNLVVWPYNRDFLLKTVDGMRDYLRGSDFNHLLEVIFYQIRRNNHQEDDCEYREMYFELWRSSPIEHRRYVVEHLNIYLALKYFKSGETELFKLLLSEANVRQKERLFLDELWLPSYRLFACKKRWNFLKFFIEACGTSRAAIVRFKTHLTTGVDLDLDNCENADFFQFLDNFHPE